mmetsp:Transcript_83597/g.139545  ORF Transcript_83597/g.139545 Transcript_83597/m.139545 type:complete len:257 (+) Transcript_83597:55-825(+)
MLHRAVQRGVEHGSTLADMALRTGEALQRHVSLDRMRVTLGNAGAGVGKGPEDKGGQHSHSHRLQHLPPRITENVRLPLLREPFVDLIEQGPCEASRDPYQHEDGDLEHAVRLHQRVRLIPQRALEAAKADNGGRGDGDTTGHEHVRHKHRDHRAEERQPREFRRPKRCGLLQRKQRASDGTRERGSDAARATNRHKIAFHTVVAEVVQEAKVRESEPLPFFGAHLGDQRADNGATVDHRALLPHDQAAANAEDDA